MTIQHTANDVGFYVGNLYNISPDTQDFLWIIKSALKTYNWVILASGDGIGAGAYTAGDMLTNNTKNNGQYTNSPSVANSIANSRAWFLAKTPTAAPVQGYLTFQNIQSAFGNGVRIKFSRGGFDLTTANNESTPSGLLGDEQVLVGAGDDITLPTGIDVNGANGSWKFNMGIEDDTSKPFFWIANWPNGDAVNTSFIMFFDFCEDLDTADDYPYIAAARSLLSNPGTGDKVGKLWPSADFITPFAGGFAASGFATSKAVGVEAMGYNFAEGDSFARSVNLNTDQNTITSKEDTTRLMWCRSNRNATPIGRKGKSIHIRWAGKLRTKADHLNDPTTRNFVFIDGVWVPWTLSGTDCIL